MNGTIEAAGLRQRHLRLIILALALLSGTITLIALGQLVAAGLALLVGALLVEIERRNARTIALARRIIAGQAMEKIEVSQGEWGELCRAINRLVQEQRLNERLRSATPIALPDDGVRALIDGKLPSSGEARTVAILLVGCRGGARRLEPRSRRATLVAWQSLANTAHTLALHHGALLQPCGDSIMLVFGAFTERPAEVTLRAALDAAQALRDTWREGGPGGQNLAISITSGPAVVATLPGIGCYILGAPVEQALQIERLALASSYYQVLCGESAYYTLRRAENLTWRPTEFRIQTNDGGPQVVYGLNTALPAPVPQ